MMSEAAKKKLAEKRKSRGGENSSSRSPVNNSKATPNPLTTTLVTPLPLPTLTLSSFASGTFLVASGSCPSSGVGSRSNTNTFLVRHGGSSVFIVSEVVLVIKELQAHIPQNVMHDLRELSIPGSIDSLYIALGHVNFLSLSFYLSLNLTCTHILYSPSFILLAGFYISLSSTPSLTEREEGLQKSSC